MTQQQPYRTDETVEITLRAKVNWHGEGAINVSFVGVDTVVVSIPLVDDDGVELPTVAIARVEPATGPVQVGDVYHDANDVLWFTRHYCPDWTDDPDGLTDRELRKHADADGLVLVLSSTTGGPCGTSDHLPEYVSRHYGPLTLMYRAGGA